MTNRDTDAARSYHDATKLGYINLSNKPPLYKAYPGSYSTPLPTDFPTADVSTLQAVASSQAGPETPLDLSTLARILYLSAGVVRKARLQVAGEVHYRAAASAGALYPIEIYAVSGGIPGLQAGVYHFSPADFSLTRLRDGDHRNSLASAVDGDSLVLDSPVSLVLTANFWRSAWKYRARSYRYCLWDAGTILSNLLAAASTSGLPAPILAGFLDETVNEILGLDSHYESTLCVVPLGRLGLESVAAATDSRISGPIQIREADQPQNIVDYPEIQGLHEASNLESVSEVTAWRQAAHGITSTSGESSPTGQIHTVNSSPLPDLPLDDVIAERGSTRRFDRGAIPFDKFSAVLTAASTPVDADFLGSGQHSLLDPYLIVNGVEHLPSGSYFWSTREARLEELQQGELRHEAGHLCFEQALGADASAVIYFMADLGKILDRHGNRGYRAAQMEAGILGGRIYLCAHALGLGASGMTFYDDDVSEFFSPHAAGKSLMFLVALGKTHTKNRVRPFRSKIGVLLDSLARGAGGQTN